MANSFDMNNKNVQAFLAMIRQHESKGHYNVIVGGSLFSDYSRHPRKYITLNINGKAVKSSAAGAYQFIFSTWDNIRAKLKLPDFSPASQDIAAVELLSQIGAYDDIVAGRFNNALKLASSQWASLPYSKANQNPVAYLTAKNTYTQNGGSIV